MKCGSKHLISWSYVAVLVVLLASVIGCDTGGRDVGDVEGTITVDGQPAADGSISFIPLDGKSPTAGGSIKEGTYQADVPLGLSKVEIRIPKVVGERKAYNTPDSHMIPIVKEVLPGKYNDYSELEVDVQAGPNQYNFDLLSK